jgi:phosphatidylglycerophosphatase A
VATVPVETRAVDRLAYLLALWFGCGRVPLAPGTAGTLGAVPLYLALRAHGLAPVAFAALLVGAVGVWASGRVAARLRQRDPQIVCIDEVTGVLITWLSAPEGWPGTVAGFVAFRVFDQCKPWPARLVERKLPGGWGIVLDDVVAGIFGAALLAALRWVTWLT